MLVEAISCKLYVVIVVLSKYGACHGMPASILSNCHPWFTSYFWHSLINALDCKLCLSMAFHPEIDGLSKRMHRSIQYILCCYVSA